jgi:hemoglobin
MSETPSEGAARRARIVSDIVSRTGIDEAMIERLVREFYGRARRDPLIGPIFETHVHDWEDHIARICDFWSSVVLMTGRYHGQPMAAHFPLPVGEPQFTRWLEIFAATANELCPPAAAALFVERAQRIAESLRLGLAAQKGEAGPLYVRPAETDSKREALIARLNELLEAERAGARVTRDTAREADGEMAVLMRDIEHDEARWCAMLFRHVQALGGKPSAKLGAFYGKAMAIADLAERTRFLNRGQGWVVRKLRELLPSVTDADMRDDLVEMLEAHEANIARAEAALLQ